MKHVITGEDSLFGPWMAEQLTLAGFPMVWIPGKGSTIGLLHEQDGPIAACFYESFNGSSILVHLAAVGKKWLNREFLWFCFYYPFEQLKVRKIIAPICSSNKDSIRWTEHCGFRLEATLLDATPKGNMLLFTMKRADCKWLSLKGKKSGQTPST